MRDGVVKRGLVCMYKKDFGEGIKKERACNWNEKSTEEKSRKERRSERRIDDSRSGDSRTAKLYGVLR